MYSSKWLRGMLWVFLAAFSASAFAQAYPAKPVRLVVSFSAGGPTDVVARILGEKLAGMWGQPVVVENRPGAGGTIGSALVARAAPDGYTLNLAASSHAFNDALIGNLPYDPIKDFTPVSLVVSYSAILVTHPSVPVDDLRMLVNYAKANPGKLAFASSGSGTGAHLAAELFRRAANIDILIVHFKGAAPATTDLVAGRLQAMFNNPFSAMRLIKNGQVRALATTGLKRSPATPDVPTVDESGYPGFKTDTWFGILGPAGLPKAIVSKVANDVGTVLSMADVRQSLASQGLEPTGSTPDQLAELMQSDHDLYATLIRDAKIKAN